MDRDVAGARAAGTDPVQPRHRTEPDGWADQAARQLAATDLLADLPSSALAELAARVTLRPLGSGATLFNEGDEGDSAYLVDTGRLRADCGGRVVGEVGRGELVGELSLLAGKPRTATVTAVRDSQLVVLEADVFNDVLSRHEQCYRAVSRQLVDRLQRVLTATSATGRAAIIALLSDGRPVSDHTVGLLTDRLGPGVAVVRDTDADLTALEAANTIVALTPDPGDPAGQRWALRQSDRALVVVDAGSRPLAVAPLPLVGSALDGRNPELVLVHPASTACPFGTRRWLDALSPPRHHHVRVGETDDADRVVRRVTGRERVLVLSGGGARGLAHAGLWRALCTRGVGIDGVVGTSAGAVAGAIIAMGHDAGAGGRLAMQLFSDGGSPIDLTLPTVSLASGARLTSRLRELCGETRMVEDQWMDLSIVSANLTTTDTHVHRSGSLWRALRASTAIPGVFPPVIEPDGVLVDGGVVDNLPVGLARRLHPGATVLAGDVGRKMELAPSDFPPESEAGRWKDVRSRLGRNRRPGIIRILAQVTALGGAGSTQEPADLHIEFDLDRYGMFDFRKGHDIIEAGHHQAAAELDRIAHLFPDLFTDHTTVGAGERSRDFRDGVAPRSTNPR